MQAWCVIDALNRKSSRKESGMSFDPIMEGMRALEFFHCRLNSPARSGRMKILDDFNDPHKPLRGLSWFE